MKKDQLKLQPEQEQRLVASISNPAQTSPLKETFFNELKKMANELEINNWNFKINLHLFS